MFHESIQSPWVRAPDCWHHDTPQSPNDAPPAGYAPPAPKATASSIQGAMPIWAAPSAPAQPSSLHTPPATPRVSTAASHIHRACGPSPPPGHMASEPPCGATPDPQPRPGLLGCMRLHCTHSVLAVTFRAHGRLARWPNDKSSLGDAGSKPISMTFAHHSSRPRPPALAPPSPRE